MSQFSLYDDMQSIKFAINNGLVSVFDRVSKELKFVQLYKCKENAYLVPEGSYLFQIL